MLKVVLIGYGEMASALTIGILKSNHKLVGILRWEKAQNNKLLYFLKKIFWPDKLTTIVKANNLYEIKAKRANSEQFKKEILKLNPDIILVGSWGEIFKKDTILLPTTAFINCHPSLLPKYRGSNPYSATIMNGEERTGITFHLVDEGIDTGPILFQKEVSISNRDNAESLRNKCSFMAGEAIIELLNELDTSTIIPVNQDEKKSSYFPQINDKDAKIDWNKPPQEIYNQIRGLNPWLQCYTIYKQDFLMIKSAQIIEFDTQEAKPAKILKKTKNSLLVSTIEKNKAILLEGISVYGFLSILWSWIFIRNIKINTFLK